MSEKYSFTVYAIQLPKSKTQDGKFKYAVKRTTPPYRGRWVLAPEVYAGDYGGGWTTVDEVKKEVRSFLNSKAATDAKIISATVVKLLTDVTLDPVVQIYSKKASVVDRIAQTDL